MSHKKPRIKITYVVERESEIICGDVRLHVWMRDYICESENIYVIVRCIITY